MPEPVKARRAYDSSRRRVEARATAGGPCSPAAQRAVPRPRLRRDRRWPTSPPPAGVSIKNLYKVFGNKVGLAKACSTSPSPVTTNPSPWSSAPRSSKVRDEPDPRRKMLLYGQHLASVAPRHVPFQLVILDAAANDPEAAKVWDAAPRRAPARHGACSPSALAAEGHLRRWRHRDRGTRRPLDLQLRRAVQACSSSSAAGPRSATPAGRGRGR